MYQRKQFLHYCKSSLCACNSSLFVIEGCISQYAGVLQACCLRSSLNFIFKVQVFLLVYWKSNSLSYSSFMLPSKYDFLTHQHYSLGPLQDFHRHINKPHLAEFHLQHWLLLVISPVSSGPSSVSIVLSQIQAFMHASQLWNTDGLYWPIF